MRYLSEYRDPAVARGLEMGSAFDVIADMVEFEVGDRSRRAAHGLA